MKKTRVISWTSEEDTLLAEAILTSVRNGRTTGDACRTVAGQLGRTPGACKFRWTHALRKRYEPQLEEARRDKVRSGQAAHTNLDHSQLVQSVNGYLNTFDHEYHKLINRIQTLVAKRDQLHVQVNDLSVAAESDITASLEQLHEKAQFLAQMVIRTNNVFEQK